VKKNFFFTVILVLIFAFSGCETGENIGGKGTIYVHASSASSLEIANNSRGYTFPNTLIGESAEVAIVVKNTGSGNIKLTGNPYVNLVGETAAFSVSSPLETSTISPESSASFKIKYAPINAGENYVFVSIPNNSENAPDFSFTVYGTGVRPKPTASVFYGENEIAQNGTIAVGEVRITKSIIIPVIIKNTGREVLTIDTENITISGADADAFTRTTNPGGSVSVGEQTYFNIEYKPVSQGENNAVLSIPTNDNSRNPVIVYLRATAGAAPKPTASVFYGNTEIFQNNTIDAGIEILTQTKDIYVIIKNTGEEVLALDTANITITGADAAVFVKSTNPGDSISVGGQTSFNIECTPAREGESNAVLTIPTNDNSRNPVVIYLKVSAIQGHSILKLSQGSTDISNNFVTPFGQVDVQTSKDLTFTIKNDGNLPLVLTGTPIVESSNDVFTVITQPSNTTINVRATVSFVVRYTPRSEQEDTGEITILNNSDDMVFKFSVKGNGYVKKPLITVQQGVSAIQPHGEFNFGTIAEGKTSSITFTIKNSGDANLSFITVDDNRVNLTDNASGFFSVTQQPLASTVVTPENTTTFAIRFSPLTVGSNFTAAVVIKTNSRNNDEFVFTVKGTARPANSEARLSGMQFSTGALVPEFNSNIYEYDLRIQEGPTLVTVRPASVDANITAIQVNGISQASGVLSQDIILASNNSVTIEVFAEDAASTAAYTVNIVIVKTWEKLHGAAGSRYGIVRAISNGSGGLYAGGYTSNNTAALFNIDGNGNLQNTFTFSSHDGTIGPFAIGMSYNDYYSVYWDYDIRDYYITRTTNPSVSPNHILISTTYNNDYVYSYPSGIVRDSSGWYYVAGNAHYAASTTAAEKTYGVFINRHYNDGSFEKGKPFSLSLTGIKPSSFVISGMTLLTNGDVLLYGQAETTAGRTVAFAAAVNVSAANAASWTVRWSNTYEIANKASSFENYFWDNSSNIVLLGQTDDGGFVVKFPGSATTASAAKPAGWPKVIAGTYGIFVSGLALSDNSGYIFVGSVGWGGGTGPYGGEDAWIVKTDLNVTNKTWENFFGGTGDDWSQSIVEVSDGFLIAGAAKSPVIAGQTRRGTEDIYLLKINKDGTMD